MQAEVPGGGIARIPQRQLARRRLSAHCRAPPTTAASGRTFRQLAGPLILEQRAGRTPPGEVLVGGRGKRLPGLPTAPQTPGLTLQVAQGEVHLWAELCVLTIVLNETQELFFVFCFFTLEGILLSRRDQKSSDGTQPRSAFRGRERGEGKSRSFRIES